MGGHPQVGMQEIRNQGAKSSGCALLPVTPEPGVPGKPPCWLMPEPPKWHQPHPQPQPQLGGALRLEQTEWDTAPSPRRSWVAGRRDGAEGKGTRRWNWCPLPGGEHSRVKAAAGGPIPPLAAVMEWGVADSGEGYPRVVFIQEAEVVCREGGSSQGQAGNPCLTFGPHSYPAVPDSQTLPSWRAKGGGLGAASGAQPVIPPGWPGPHSPPPPPPGGG